MEQTTAPFTRSIARKYSKIIIAILIFIFLDLGVLVLNFYVSYQIQGDAVGVNLSGRQRMLTQRTIKALYQIQTFQQAGQPIEEPAKELALSFKLFDSTLAAFAAGGSVMGGDNQLVTLKPVESERARQALNDATALWTDYRVKLQAVITAPTPIPDDVLASALEAANQKNVKLLVLMNDLTTDLEKVASGKAAMLRTIQTVAIILVLLNFIYIIFDVIRELKRLDAETERYAASLQEANDQLARTSQELASAKQESDTIFAAVRQGLFLLKPDFTIGTQNSHELSTIFGLQDLAGRPLLDILKPFITHKLYQTTSDFLTLLFDVSKRKKDLKKFNPLSRIEANFSQPNGGFQTRYLEFSFEQIPGPKGIDRVLVSVVDNTGQVRLMNQLKATEERTKREFNLLFNVLHVEPTQLKGFIEEASESVLEINQTLKQTELQPNEISVKRPILDRIFRLVHILKSNAATLGLTVFEETAHEMEEKLDALRHKDTLAGEDFLPALLALSDLQALLDEVRSLIKKISRLDRTFQATPTAASSPPPTTAPAVSTELDFIPAVNQLHQELKARTQKMAEINWTIDPKLQISPARLPLLRDVLLQLVRNSYVHGLESPEIRLARGKPAQGYISIDLQVTANPSGRIHLHYKDDGQGLAVEKIRQKAIAQKLLAPERQVNVDEICSFIFSPGFSTADQVTPDAGRGVGLDVVRQLVIDDLGGDIRLESLPERYCEFKISLPA